MGVKGAEGRRKEESGVVGSFDTHLGLVDQRTMKTEYLFILLILHRLRRRRAYDNQPPTLLL